MWRGLRGIVGRRIGSSGVLIITTVEEQDADLVGMVICDNDDRDLEFDLEGDKNRCLFGVLAKKGDGFCPADVHRVTQIFDKPEFFVGGKPDSNDIVQGALGDCWFLSALATVSNAPELVKTFCVDVRNSPSLCHPIQWLLRHPFGVHTQRDEEVGVYGFIFFRDNGWETVVIDE